MVLIVIAALIQLVYYYPQLPTVVASHFNSAGIPNGWQPKGAFFSIYCGVILLMIIIFPGTAFFLDRIPDSLINLPRKEYWLAPERREETFSFINRQMLTYGNATLIFLVAVFHLAIKANLTTQKQLPSTSMLLMLGAYLLFSLLWTVRFILKFKK